VSLKEKMRIIL